MSSLAPTSEPAQTDCVSQAQSLVMRLAGPLQSWGGQSQFNRRDTSGEPTKSGILGLLAAAQGRRRLDPIEDLLALRLGVRTDQPGSLLRDYHTVSDLRHRPLLSAQVNAKGRQKQTSPAKFTYVTERFYLQDAVFVVAVSGPVDLLNALAAAVRRPCFPLALGRRACAPTQPLVISPPGVGWDEAQSLWPGEPADVLGEVAWMASESTREALRRNARREEHEPPAVVRLPITHDDECGPELRSDVPSSFAPQKREFMTRRVRQGWAIIATGFEPADGESWSPHDPFALLGW
jgi:CRISPR system Cascade subunit CasD